MSLPSAATNLQMNDQTLWIAIAAAGAVMLYVLMRPKGKRREPPDASPRFSLSRQREAETQMSGLLVELSQMARQITAQLDTRAAKLELLIKEADERLAALRATQLASQNPAENNKSQVGRIVLAAQEAEALQTFPELPTSEPPQPPLIDERYAEVYALADAGHTANEIGRQLARPAGEVELILALRPR